MWIAQAFIIAKEEGAVASVVQVGNRHGSAQAGAEIVGHLVRLVAAAPRSIRNCVQELVLQIFVSRAVQFVGAALGDRGDLAGLAIFGVVVYAVYANFRDSFGGGKGVAWNVVVGLVLRRDAIDRGLGLRRQAALQRKL